MSTRVFLPQHVNTPQAPALSGERVVLDRDESHYLRRVRRLREGATLEAIDPRGTLWLAELLGGDADASELRLLHERPAPAPARELLLLLGAPEPSAFLDLLPALCELGVAEIVLIRCARSQGAAPSPERIGRVLRAAQRQCGRPIPPAVLGPLSLADAIAHRSDLPGFFAWEKLSTDSCSEPRPTTCEPLIPSSAGARLCVGPEGGFIADEATALADAGFRALGLGPYILRTGTAAMVGLARLLFA